MANSDNSKQWFETGDYPTQAQFAQVFDWLRWKDEQVVITDITGLQTILNGLATAGSIVTKDVFIIDGSLQKNYTIPAGYLLTQFIILPLADCTPTASYAPAPTGTFIAIDGIETVTLLEGFVWTGNIMAVANRDILLTALPVGSTVIFIKIKIV